MKRYLRIPDEDDFILHLVGPGEYRLSAPAARGPRFGHYPAHSDFFSDFSRKNLFDWTEAPRSDFGCIARSLEGRLCAFEPFLAPELRRTGFALLCPALLWPDLACPDLACRDRSFIAVNIAVNSPTLSMLSASLSNSDSIFDTMSAGSLTVGPPCLASEPRRSVR